MACKPTNPFLAVGPVGINTQILNMSSIFDIYYSRSKARKNERGIVRMKIDRIQK